VARQNSGGFVAGLVVGGLVGAALALLYKPQGGPVPGGENAEALLNRGREALRERFQQATTEAQQAARETEQRLQSEYRSVTDIS
jgi:gas vesicle protein